MTPRIAVPLAALAFLAAAAPAAVAQNEKLSVLQRGAGRDVESYILDAGGRAVFTTESPLQLWSLPLDGSAPPVRLHDGSTEGSLQDYQVTADGAWTVYRVSTNRIRLRAMRTDGSAPGHHVNAPLGEGGNVLDMRLSPSSTYAVYRADAHTDEVYELFGGPIDLSASVVRLSGPMTAGGDVTADYRISPDGRWVVYLADQDADEVYDLYSAPLDGSGAARRLNLSRPLADVWADFAIAHDSLGVVYRANQDTLAFLELYGVRIDGAFGPFKRSAPLVTGGDVRGFGLSPVDDRIVYRADQDVDEQVELYSVRAVAGGTPVRLNALLGGNRDVSDFQFAPDGARVVYRADQVTDQVGELFSAPTDGSAPAVRVHAPLGAGRGVSLFSVSPDGEHVLFAADRDTRLAEELYRAPIDGSAPEQRLSSTFLSGSEVRSIAFDPGGTRVVYLADERSYGVPELYSVPVDGSQLPAHLNRDLATGGAVHAMSVTADGLAVIYAAEQRSGHGVELFRVPITGAAPPLVLTVPFPRGGPAGDVVRYELAAQGREVLYTTDLVLDEVRHVSPDGPTAGERVSGPGGNETLMAISPDGRHAVLRRPAGPDLGGMDVIRRRVDESAPPVLLYHHAAVDSLSQVVITPDSTRALFWSSGGIQLFSAPLDGSQPAVSLHTRIQADVQLSPDGTRAVYLRSATTGGPVEIYSVLVDGSQPPVRVNAPLPAGGTVPDQTNAPRFAVTPDGTRVVYVCEQETDDVVELFSAPIDGSAPPVKLSGTLVAGGDVRIDLNYRMQVSSDGAWVVYSADQQTDEVVELYRAPVLGGAPPVKLSGALVAGGDVGGSLPPVRLSADAQWVVYLADATVDEQKELFAVRLDGTTSPVQLNDILPADGDVENFRIDPTSSRVVYQVRAPSLFFADLHAVPIDGTAPAVLLTQHAETGGSGDAYYDVTPDGAHVVFTAHLDDVSANELYIRRIDAGAPPVKLSGPMVVGGDVNAANGQRFTIAPDGSRVLYLADQDVNDQVELFVTYLDHRPRGANAPARSVVR